MLPQNYEETVYAGVLGKIIGVYLGRPFEGWTNQRIEERLGDIDYYVHDKVGVRLIVTDDDISGTFTFIRALEDYNYDPQLTSKQIGQTWLNYLVEGRSVLWWGGLGNSTEHTAYLRLKQGLDAPASGSIACNGQVVAEQIGAQIFIDGWALVNPGDPERAADFARRAGSVSHDGESVYGAMVLAAMEAAAFEEKDLDKLVDIGQEQIPKDSTINRMINDIRAWHQENPDDWRATFKQIQANYGYDKYGGNCHIVPNHGLIILGFLHGDGDFQKSLKIVNTAGWDTDCNSGNLGCLMGIRNGIEGIDAGPDWRTPFGDICYVPTADSGSGITDAATIARNISIAGAKLNGAELTSTSKNGARYNFSYPGSVQGFRGTGCEVSNQQMDSGERVLTLSVNDASAVTGAYTDTFIDSKETAQYFSGRGYGLMTSPNLNPGQTVTMTLLASSENTANLSVKPAVRIYNEDDEIVSYSGDACVLQPGERGTLEYTVPDPTGLPVCGVGVELENATNGSKLHLVSLDWHGTPNITLTRKRGDMWWRAWVNAVSHYHHYFETFRLIQDSGTGMVLYGNRDWDSYKVSADITPHLVNRVGLAARVQGLKRYYALVLTGEGKLQIVRELDGRKILNEVEYPLELGRTYQFDVTVNGNQISGSIDGDTTIEANDNLLTTGGIGLLIDEGRTATQSVSVSPVE
ncbi:MAG: ADP-ribosylglycohydrolase family protein [Gammaproteobacteria bacterium]|nr:ADP-ribosylglycohydrolase family protein [Gammaproteobacteria bacterium]